MNITQEALALTPDAEWTVLDDLLRSEGWAVYEAAMKARWSDTQQVADIRAVMTEVSPGTDVTPFIGQINATYDGMRKMLAWPRDRMRTLKGGKAAGVFEDVFAKWRRVPRHA